MMTEHTTLSWLAAIQAELGVELKHWQQLGGGDFAQSYQATVQNISHARPSNCPLSAGDKVFVKTHADPPPRHFTTEAMGLAWLTDADCIRVPRVLAVNDNPGYLVLEWIDESARRPQRDEAFGRSLAALHQAPCTHFGRKDERSTGSLGLPNTASTDWCEFFSTQRLIPLARIASDRQALSASMIKALEAIASRLSDLAPPDLSPSRLHGDLWAGNRLIDTEGHSWLIDPASHGGHREFDLAMMRLFGGFGEDSFSAYHEVFPLHDGWQDRIALHQLPPLVVHTIKFGQSYVGPTRAALAQYT